MIFTTAYTSEMVRPMSDPELADLLVDARARNADRGITGLLLYRAGRVMQMLEGDAGVHQHVTNVWTSTAVDRRFPSWTIGFDDLERDERPMPLDGRPSSGQEQGVLPQSPPHEPSRTAEQQDYVERRRAALRRALVSGDRLVGALGIILDGHEPEVLEDTDGTPDARCRECRSRDDPLLNAYPARRPRTRCGPSRRALRADRGD